MNVILSRILPRVRQQSNNVCRNRITTKLQPPKLQPLNNNNTLRPISYTSSIQAQITVNVPTMGDSITEGTIVEWCVPPGSHVNEGDVLALVETDKVTVDIKAEQEGVLVKQLGDVDDNVEVGQGLYVLDTDVSVASSSSSVEKTTDVSEVNASLDAEKMVVDSPSSSTTSTSTRVPSIHFLGKEGWKERLTATDEPSASTVVSSTSQTTTIIPPSNKPNMPSSITHIPYSAMYGRPPITEEEMEALILGGAEEAPEVKSISSSDGLSGVVFVGGKITTAGPRGVWLAE